MLLVSFIICFESEKFKKIVKIYLQILRYSNNKQQQRSIDTRFISNKLIIKSHHDNGSQDKLK